MLFSDFELSEPTSRSLHRQNFVTPTPIQERCLPILLKGRDLVGKAETGSGKTLAFGIPMIERVEANRVSIQALCICPTRELAQQVSQDLEELGTEKGVRVALVTGGVHIRTQRMKIPGRQVVVGTPGRMLDLLEDRFLPVEWVEYLVLDEFDRLLDMGFLDDIKRIVGRLPKERQTALFSATAPAEIMRHARALLTDPAFVETSSGVTTAAKARQRAIRTKTAHKLQVLERLLAEDAPENESIIVFCNTKRQVRQLDRELWGKEISVAAISGDYEQSARFKVIERFRNQEVRVLVATDVAARGLDIDHVGHVINYDVPFEVEDYVHRIGRTARAGRGGMVTTLVGDEDSQSFRRIRSAIDQEIEMVAEPTRSARPRARVESAIDAEVEVAAAVEREAAPRRVAATESAAAETSFGYGIVDASPLRRDEPIYADEFDDVERGAGLDRAAETERERPARSARRGGADASADRGASRGEARSDGARERGSREARRRDRAPEAGGDAALAPDSRETRRPRRDDASSAADRDEAEGEDAVSRRGRRGRGRGRGRDEARADAEAGARAPRDAERSTSDRDDAPARASRDARRSRADRDDEGRASRDDGRETRRRRGRGDERSDASRLGSERARDERRADVDSDDESDDASSERGRRGRRSRGDYKRWEEEQLSKPTGLITDDWTAPDEVEGIDVIDELPGGGFDLDEDERPERDDARRERAAGSRESRGDEPRSRGGRGRRGRDDRSSSRGGSGSARNASGSARNESLSGRGAGSDDSRRRGETSRGGSASSGRDARKTGDSGGGRHEGGAAGRSGGSSSRSGGAGDQGGEDKSRRRRGRRGGRGRKKGD